MVITCPSCSARYRLSPDKIKGRGAKITCPKCAHVFVVFAESGAEEAPPTPAPTREIPSAPAGPRSPDRATTTGAFKAVGFEEDEVPATRSGEVRVVAPGARKTRRSMTSLSTNDRMPALTRNIATDDVAAAAEAAADGAPRTASELDFRSVGITTWKVRVKIGLVYDFSDISTLKKYLADGKVTRDDLISSDAKEWTRIGDIDDLDQHFIDVWVKAKAVYKGDAAKPPKKVAPNATVELPRGMVDEVARATGSTSTRAAAPRTTGSMGVKAPAPAPAKAPKSSRPPTKEPSGTTRIALLVLLGLIVVGVGWIVVDRMTGNRTDEIRTHAQAATATTAPDAAQKQAFEAEFERKMREERERIASEEAARLAAQREKEERERVPVPVRATSPVTPPPVAPMVTARPPIAAVATAAPASGGGTAGVYLTTGQKMLASGNFVKAKEFLDQAVQRDPGCGACYAALAEAYTGLGDAAAAGKAAERARALGAGR